MSHTPTMHDRCACLAMMEDALRRIRKNPKHAAEIAETALDLLEQSSYRTKPKARKAIHPKTEIY
jgi:truncated hemoglobin YjbI